MALSPAEEVEKRFWSQWLARSPNLQLGALSTVVLEDGHASLTSWLEARKVDIILERELALRELFLRVEMAQQDIGPENYLEGIVTKLFLELEAHRKREGSQVRRQAIASAEKIMRQRLNRKGRLSSQEPPGPATSKLRKFPGPR